MFSTMHRPAYRDDVGPVGLAPLHHTTTALHSTASSPYRPTFSSPLSSSPIRASTMTPPGTPPSPVSPCSSSPIFGASGTSHYNHNNNDDAPSSPVNGTKPSIFKFANRGPARPNPLTAQKREAAQESRRKLFLKNVRQRAEDRRWERRGGEQELLKLEWSSLNKDIQQARNADLDGVVFESDIEDAARLREEVMRKPPPPLRALLEAIPEEAGDADAMMVDMFEQEQEAELQALVSSMAAPGPPPPVSPHWSDDDEYDALFADFLSREQQARHPAPESGDMDLS